MDNRDEIIRTQMDVIGTLINNNLRHVADDFWGTPGPIPHQNPKRNAADNSKSSQLAVQPAEKKKEAIASEDDAPPERADGKGKADPL